MAEFLAAEVVVIGTPMYNFSVASQLKAWIDRIVQPGRTFRYTATVRAENLSRGDEARSRSMDQARASVNDVASAVSA